MATLAISVSGSALVNASKSYTINDADLQTLLSWAQVSYANALPVNPTSQQILLAWVQGWIDATRANIQQVNTPAPTVPAKISIA